LGATVGFYTLTGEHVADGAPVENNVSRWDGRNKNGAFVSTGVYYWVAQQGGSVLGKGKFLVTR
jgi:hypothetical protein